MKKTAIGFLSLLLISALCAGCLMGCGKGENAPGEGAPLGEGVAKFTDVFRVDPDLDIDNGYKTQKLLSLPAEMSDTQEGGPFFAYLDVVAGNYCVYNVDLDKTVLTLPAAEIADGTDISLYDEYIAVIATRAGEKSTSIYGEGGVLLTSAKGEETLNVGSDGFVFAEKLYHVEDGAVKKTYDVPAFFSVSDVAAFTDTYLLCRTSRGMVFYDTSLAAVATYEVPGTVDDYDIHPLSNGKIFVTYTEPCDIASEEYDFFVQNYGSAQNKYRVHSEIFDPETGKATALSLGVAPISLYNDYNPVIGNAEFYDVFQSSVDNILAYYLITDGQLDRSQAHYVLIDNDGTVGKSLDGFVEGQRGIPRPLSESCYRVPTDRGYAILDGEGKVLSSAISVTGLEARDYGFCRRVYDNVKGVYTYTVYGQDLSQVLSLPANEMTDENEGVIIYKKTASGETNYYCYTRAGEREVTAPEGYLIADRYGAVSVGEGYYTVALMEADNKYETITAYYSYDGELLLMTASMTVLAEAENAALIRYTDASGERVYARLTK